MVDSRHDDMATFSAPQLGDKRIQRCSAPAAFVKHHAQVVFFTVCERPDTSLALADALTGYIQP